MYTQIELPREALHSRRCLAAAIIAAVENLRDQDEQTDFGFRVAMQNNDHLNEADSYLTTGTMTCTCHVRAMAHVSEVYVLKGRDEAQTLAESYLENRTISPNQYVTLVRWSEGRD